MNAIFYFLVYIFYLFPMGYFPVNMGAKNKGFRKGSILSKHIVNLHFYLYYFTSRWERLPSLTFSPLMQIFQGPMGRTWTSQCGTTVCFTRTRQQKWRIFGGAEKNWLELGESVPGAVHLLGLGIDPVLELPLVGEVAQQRVQVFAVSRLDPAHLILLLHLVGSGVRCVCVDR